MVRCNCRNVKVDPSLPPPVVTPPPAPKWPQLVVAGLSERKKVHYRAADQGGHFGRIFVKIDRNGREL